MNSFVNRIREDSDDIRYYGIEPQASAIALMFEIRTRDGICELLEYAHLVKAKYNPSEGELTMVMFDSMIVIKGRGLKEILPFIRMHRLTYLQEDDSGIDNEDGKLFIESIQVQARTNEQS